ncbi:alpha/beta fold hydrolase [Alkalimarinus alittae]|uniref:Alpha/beta fold hydrolase n=1 Tax=Alkalimarinus alittae TaxID=2961619 RepID=A0ABY6MZX6_9ALTE|nr:alpha/beta fold hydrolase [Alkalimarinus alittae]UZE95299.1 alpha/beta fold hydrolase [Alkalimarinus alittae]
MSVVNTSKELRNKYNEVRALVERSTSNAKQRFFQTDKLLQAEKTPFEIIYQKDIVRLRYYPPLKTSEIIVDGETVSVAKNTHKIPLVMVAPLAVNMYIYDLFPERSLVKYLRAKGFELYLIDWGRPGWDHNHYTISSYFAELMPDVLAKVRGHSGSKKLSLHGWSFGGLFSACYTSLGDPDIVNLALVGAPGDYHANGELGKQYRGISRKLNWLDKKAGWRVHNTPRRWWRSPGWVNSLAFKLTNPIGSLQGYLDLLKNLHDEEYVISHATNGAFLDNMVAYPGAVIQDVIQYLWADNIVARGELPMKDAQGRFANIKSNMLLVVGKQDPIVTKDCSVAMLEHVASTDQQVLEVEGGHMGILSGSKAPKTIWPEVAEWLATRSN